MYGAFYKRLREQVPDLCGEGEAFQFALPTVSAGWEETQDARLYTLLDTIPAEAGNYYFAGIGRLSAYYRTYLQCLEGEGREPVCNQARLRLESMDRETMEVLEEGEGILQMPAMTLSGDLKGDIDSWDRQTEERFCQTFSSEHWTDEPLEFQGRNGRIPASQVLQAEDYTFDIQIKAMGCYEIQRGSWFCEDLLRQKLESDWNIFADIRMIPVRILVIQNMMLKLHIKQSPSLEMGGRLVRSRMGGSGGLTSMLPFDTAYFLGMPVQLYREGGRLLRTYTPAARNTSVLGVTSRIIGRDEER